MKKLGIVIFTAITLSLLSQAQAHTRHHHYSHRHVPGIIVGLGEGFKHMMDTADRNQGFQLPNLWTIPPQGWPLQPMPSRHERRYEQGSIVDHPSGCPRTAFCGCGVSVRVFGHSVRNLWLAANWLAFPRASIGPGVVLARRHHVQYVERIEGGVPICYDPNSGGHMTRVHPCQTAGYVAVNPRG